MKYYLPPRIVRGIALVMAVFAALAGARAAAPEVQLNDVDRFYIATTSHGLTSEVLLGRLALTHSSNSAVRAFGRLMIDNHSRDYTQLRGIAARVGAQFFAVPNEAQRAEYAKLSVLFGPDFDKEYITFEIADHITDIHQYLDEVQHGDYLPAKLYANNHLQELFRHLQLARAAGVRAGLGL